MGKVTGVVREPAGPSSVNQALCKQVVAHGRPLKQKVDHPGFEG